MINLQLSLFSSLEHPVEVVALVVRRAIDHAVIPDVGDLVSERNRCAVGFLDREKLGTDPEKLGTDPESWGQQL